MHAYNKVEVVVDYPQVCLGCESTHIDCLLSEHRYSIGMARKVYYGIMLQHRQAPLIDFLSASSARDPRDV